METNLAEMWAAQWQSWQSNDAAPNLWTFFKQHPSATAAEKLSVLLRDQRYRWRTPHALPVEEILQQLPDLASDPDNVLQLAVGEFQVRQNGDTAVSIDEFTARFSHLGDSLRSRLEQIVAPNRDAYATVSQDPSTLPRASYIGRYRQIRLLGEGAFGTVWLGFDEELDRRVAIKVPKTERFRGPEDAAQYLAEARTVAGLDHPHIVPVYDVGRLENGSIYVVSKFIEGCTLADLLTRRKQPYEEVTKLLATAANALHHARCGSAISLARRSGQ